MCWIVYHNDNDNDYRAFPDASCGGGRNETIFQLKEPIALFNMFTLDFRVTSVKGIVHPEK